MSSAQLGPHTSGPALYRFLPPPRRHSDRRSGLPEPGGRAVDTIRVLAADAVQKVDNGHPGTPMSLAPLTYTLFQRQMRHDPSDVHWLGRDRFAGHSSLTLYRQLFLGGFGLELSDREALRTCGSKTPGHPEFGRTRGVEITTGPFTAQLSKRIPG